jgi:hypothetical protein
MSLPAAEVFRVERDQGTTPLGSRHKAARALGTALTGLPMMGGRMKFEATVRIVDQSGEVLYETHGDSATMDALEMEILRDLMRLDEDAFRHAYGLPDKEAGA